MGSVFNAQILAEKLSKLNNSQQSIETLSHWCIFHRKKAKQVVETWEKQFQISQKEQRVSFLYLANDILQNSRRKGNEFVGEFWKVLPAVLKDLCETGDEYGRNVVFRLVDIWESRKVFGSRSRSLREEMLGKEPPSALEDNGRSSHSHSIKIVRKSPRSVRIKLAVGGAPEKIVSAFQAVHDGHNEEDATLNKCKEAVKLVEKIDKDFEHASETGTHIQNSSLEVELQEQENVLKLCIEQLGHTEKKRTDLVSLLKEVLQDQESKLELVRTQLQLAQGQLEQTANMRQRLQGITTGQVPSKNSAHASYVDSTNQQENHTMADSSMSLVLPSTSTPMGTTDDQHKKTTASVAAEVAAKLAASTSSAQMLTSVLSSFAAEEAASISSGIRSTSLPAEMSSGYLPEKRAKIDGQFQSGDHGIQYMVLVPHPQSATNTTLSMQQQQQQQHVPLQHQLPQSSMQNQTSPIPIQQQHHQHHPESSAMPQQPSYPPPPQPPPPPPQPPPMPMPMPMSMIQYMSSSGSMVAAPAPSPSPSSYGYATGMPPPPPPPLQGQTVMGVLRNGIPQQSSSPAAYQQQQQQQQQQLHPPAMAYYTQSSMPMHSPSVPRP